MPAKYIETSEVGKSFRGPIVYMLRSIIHSTKPNSLGRLT